MANTFDNISIKNKIIFGLIFTLFVSLGIGILQFNKIIKIQNSYTGRKVLSTYKSDFLDLQNLYFKLDAIVVKISNSDATEEYVESVNEFKSVNVEILSILTKMQKIEISDIKNENTIDFLSTYNDSIFEYNRLYVERINLSIDKLIEYQYLVLHPEKIREDYKRLVVEQQNIGNVISANEAYVTQDEIVLDLIRVYEESSVDLTDFVSNTLKAQTFAIDKMLYNTQEQIENDETLIASIRVESIKTSIVLFFITILFVLLLSFLISNNIIKPLLETNEIVAKLSKGNFPEKIEIKRTDEVGLILESLDELILHLKKTSEFAKNISGGNFEYSFTPSGNKDILGNSLLQLRESLLQAKKDENTRKQEDFIRSRTAEGLAKFSDILRQNQSNLKHLGREVISNLVKFLNANQGVIFLLNDENKKHVYLELLSAYAWNREKFFERRLNIGEGLVGAVAEEKFTVYMEDVPEDYIEIKSGTGAANPTSILVVPLKVDEEVLGVVELASFKRFDKYEIVLVERIAESIASTLKSVRISAQTTELLEKFQIQASEMKEQETAMRTTIVDLQKAEDDRTKKEEYLQESFRELKDLNKQLEFKDEQLKNEVEKLTLENENKLKQIKNKEKQSRQILESMLTGVVIIKQGGHIDFVNKASEKLWGYNKMEILGTNIEKLIQSPPDIGETKLCEYLFINKEKFKVDGGKEMLIQLKEGNTKKVVLEMMILEAEKQEDMRMVLFLKDMTMFEAKEEKTKEFVNKLAKKDLENVMKIEYYEKILEQNKIEMPEFVLDEKTLIKWSSKFELGIVLIDGQHKRWIEFINRLYEALSSKKSNEELNAIFKKLMNYTEYHFGFEEKYFKEFKFEEKDVHILEHEKFVAELMQMFTNYIEGKTDTIYNLILMLKNWVAHHVLVSDKKYVELFVTHGIK